MSDYYNTLVLSGGSVKCLATFGALQYCYNQKLIQGIRTYIGTSAGAIIGYLLAIGYTPLEVITYACTHEIFKELSFLDLRGMMTGGGAMDFHHIQNHLEKMTIEKIGRLVTLREVYEMFHKTLIIATYNWTLQKMEYLSYENYPDMPCLIALRMSASLPLVFEPFKYMNNYYIDGAIYDNFPITHGLDEENENTVRSRRLGIVIDDESIENKNPHEYNILEYICKLITIPTRQNTIHKLQTAKYIDVIRISKPDYSILSFDLSKNDILELFSIGYQQAHTFFVPSATVNSDQGDC